MVDYKKVCECDSVAYCKGWNDAVREIEGKKKLLMEEIDARESDYWRIVEEYGEKCEITCNASKFVSGMKKAFSLVFGQDYIEFKYCGSNNK